MSSVVDTHDHGHAGHDHGHGDHHGGYGGFMRWVTTTNHKDIGTMYLWFSFTMFLVGGTLAFGIRAELFKPGLQFVDPQFFNSMTTVHALAMIFGGMMPAWTGLANWMIPMQVGAPDMALPRMNNFSFWLLPFAWALLVLTLFLPGGAPAGAALHLARAVCRRAERRVVALAAAAEVDPAAVVYLNRLSDLLFVAARLANHRAGRPETAWAPRKRP